MSAYRKLLIAPAAVLILAPSAHADDQSFLADLAAHGITDYWGQGPDRLVYMGHEACNQLHGGGSRQSVVGMFGPLQAGFGETFTNAAQTQLCPDTLGN
ncbi:DUF732 domain-containing protein [Mycobacterium sp. SVM_VP21]|nr:DUF732 domain-containing protein [Mycobacterium sp. SVM_VP21]